MNSVYSLNRLGKAEVSISVLEGIVHKKKHKRGKKQGKYYTEEKGKTQRIH